MKKWIALGIAVLLFALSACGVDATTTAPRGTPFPTTTAEPTAEPTAAPTTQPAPSVTRPTEGNPMREEDDEYWGVYDSKTFIYMPNEEYKGAPPIIYSLELFADGRYKHYCTTTGSNLPDSGSWVFEDGILTLYDSVYLEKFDILHIYSTQLQYEDGVLTLLPGENDVGAFIICDDGTEYTFKGMPE